MCVYYILVSRYICIYIFFILFRKFNVCWVLVSVVVSWFTQWWCYSHAIHMKLRFSFLIEFADNTLTINMDIALIIKMHIVILRSKIPQSNIYIDITNEEYMYYKLYT